MRFFLICFGLAVVGCGVKAPPLAPERAKTPETANLNCSVYDPECDKQDPNYVPQGKKGKYPSPKDEE